MRPYAAMHRLQKAYLRHSRSRCNACRRRRHRQAVGSGTRLEGLGTSSLIIRADPNLSSVALDPDCQSPPSPVTRIASQSEFSKSHVVGPQTLRRADQRRGERRLFMPRIISCVLVLWYTG